MLRVKIQLMSDLHLEGHPAFQPRPAPDAELLVLAGDIGSYQRGSQLREPLLPTRSCTLVTAGSCRASITACTKQRT